MARKSKRRAAPARKRRRTQPQSKTEQQVAREDSTSQAGQLPEDEVVEASMESFPASDPPAWSRPRSEDRPEERE